MDRKKIYAITDDFIKGRWWNIALVHILTGIITFTIAIIIFSMMVKDVFMLIALASQMEPEFFIFVLMEIFAKLSIAMIIAGTFSAVVNGGLSMNVLEAYQKDGKINVSNTFANITKHFFPILVIVVITTLFNYVLVYIPIIDNFSVIISLIVGYAIAFSFYLVADGKAENGVEALTESLKATNGHKFDLFMIELRYMFKPLVGLLIVFVGLLFVAVSETFGALLMLVGFITLIVLTIKYMPYTSLARAIYYQELRVLNNDVEEIIEVEEPVEAEIIDLKVSEEKFAEVKVDEKTVLSEIEDLLEKVEDEDKE